MPDKTMYAVYIPKELHHALKVHATMTDRTLCDLATEVLGGWLKARSAPAPAAPAPKGLRGRRNLR